LREHITKKVSTHLFEDLRADGRATQRQEIVDRKREISVVDLG
jgi:hypothetical protein